MAGETVYLSDLEVGAAVCNVAVDRGSWRHVCGWFRGHGGPHSWEIPAHVTASAPDIVPTAPGAALREAKPGPARNWCTLEYESVAALAETSAEGDARYGLDNWTAGLPASNLLNHTLDHIFKLLDGDSSEPHLEHAMWNLGKLRWMAKHRPEMIDLPRIKRALGLEQGDKHGNK